MRMENMVRGLSMSELWSTDTRISFYELWFGDAPSFAPTLFNQNATSNIMTWHGNNVDLGLNWVHHPIFRGRTSNCKRQLRPNNSRAALMNSSAGPMVPRKLWNFWLGNQFNQGVEKQSGIRIPGNTRDGNKTCLKPPKKIDGNRIKMDKTWRFHEMPALFWMARWVRHEATSVSNEGIGPIVHGIYLRLMLAPQIAGRERDELPSWYGMETKNMTK